MSWYTNPDRILSITAIVFSFFALAISFWRLRILQVQEQDRIKEQKRASVKASIAKARKNNFPIVKVQIKNDGPGEARNVYVEVDGQAIRRHSAMAGGEGDLTFSVLGNGNSLTFELFDWVRLPLNIMVSWEDDSGVPGVYRSILSPP